MSKKGINVDVLSRVGADINITNTFAGLPGLAGLVPFWQQAADYVAKEGNDYDIVWLHSPFLMNTKKLRYTKEIMISFHTTYYGFYRAYKAHKISHLLPYYYFATKLEHRFFKQLSHNKNVIITAVSPSVAKELGRNGLTLFAHVIPNGLEMDNYTLLDKYHARTLLQQEYSLQLSESDQVLLYVGRITEQKQPLLLVELFEAISSLKANTHLITVGSGNLFRKMRKKARAHQHNIHILGYVPHGMIPVLLRAADAFISLSCYEGLPLTVLEAAAYGLPYILSNIPSHEELVKSGIGTGVLVDAHSPKPKEILSWISSVKSINQDENVPVRRKFSWDYVYEQYLKWLID